MVDVPHDEGRCPDEDTALRYLADGDRHNAAAIERHIDACPDCRQMFALLARTSLGVPMASFDDDDEGSGGDDGDDAGIPLGDHLPSGSAVGRYRIRRLAGRGGMGVVYEAHDPKLERLVALKVLRGDVVGRAGARLLAEAQAMARLSHPNVCPVFDVGTIGGRHYLAMPCVRRGTLVDWLGERPRTVAEIGAAFSAAGRGLAAAHAIGVVHRDFKPANVLVDGAGRVLVCDFGLAAIEHGPTLPGGGTPRYMAPEQRAGGGDARVDQFAFAVALSDALVGLVVPRRLARVLDRAQHPEAEHRYPDMRALLRAVDDALSSGPARWPRVLVVSVLAGLAVLGALRQPAVPEPPAVEALPEPPEVEPAVQALLDVSLGYDRADDPNGMAIVLELAVDEALTREDPAGIALALAARGSQRGKMGQPLEAIDDLKASFHRATQIGRDDIAADAAIMVLGLLATDLERPDEALAWGRHAEGALRRMDELEPRIVASFDQVMGRAHQAAGELDEAALRYGQAIARLREQSPILDLHLIVPLSSLAGLEVSRGNLDAALQHGEQSLELAMRVLGPDHPETGGIFGQLALVRHAHGDVVGALDALERGRAILVSTYGATHPNVLAIDASLASLLMADERYPEALAAMDEALERAPGHYPVRCALQERAGASLRFMDRCPEARPRLRNAIDCWESFGGPETPQADRARRELRRCHADG